MDDYRVVFGLQVDDEDPEAVEKFGLAVLDQLLELDGVVDPDLTATLTLGQISISFEMQAEDASEAPVKAATLLQTALHACGENTATFTGLLQEQVTTVREVARDACAV